MIEWKKCARCGETKPKSAFHNNPKQEDGKHPFCASCVNTYWRANRARRAEKRRKSRPPMVEKKCVGCGETKPVDMFYRDWGHRAGLDRLCKTCRKSNSISQRARDLDRIGSHGGD